MAPGLLLDEAALEQANAAQTPMPSKLVGPHLEVTVLSALDIFRDAFDRFSDTLAVASMYQPADYLREIFENGPKPLKSEGPQAKYLRWSFAQVRHAGELLAAGLAAKGVHEDMTIAFFAKGSIEFYMILYAALVLRCRFSPMNPASLANANEVANMLDVVRADVVIGWDEETMRRLETTAPEIAEDLVLKVCVEKPESQKALNGSAVAPWSYLEDLVRDALPLSAAQAVLAPFEQLKTDPDEDVYILFTSGTSSLPKACPLTNRNMCAISTNFAKGPTGGPGSVVCNHLPIYHIAGGISAGWNPLTSGAATVHPAPAFTAGSTLQAMKQEGVTFMVLVPTMLGLIADDPSLPPSGDLSIRSVSLGASTILYTDVEKCYALLGANRVITSYGMTEGLMMTRGHLPREVTKAALDGIQTISAGARIKICQPNSRIVVPRGEPGEVHQGGATTIRGYIGTKSNAFYTDEEGTWCMTGDQAIMHPDGGIQITGRYKDIIIRGGVNISPSAIEGVISKILRIEAHVVGMPDSIAGEVPVAIVRTSDVGKASAAKLREPIVKELGPKFALERFITLEELGLDDFPATSTGKIRKIDLQAHVKKYAINLATQEQAQQSGGNTLDRVMQTWSDVAGVSMDELTKESNVQEMADSLMLSRYANTIKNAFARPFTLQDLTDCPTLGEQAELLDSRLEPENSNADLVNKRDGPPTLDDMAHTEDSELLLLRTRQLVEGVLNPMGFYWEDVQDVVTPSQWLQSWVKSRETSDRFRAAYISKVDIPTLEAAVKETLLRNDSLRVISIPCGDTTDIQAILRHTPKWLGRVISIRKESVKKVSDLEGMLHGDYKLSHGLIQVVIAHVEETGTAGACLMTLHTTFDAFSLDTMRKDMNALLNDMKPKQHVPYKLWCDHLYNLRESAQAKTSIAYNVKRLKGLASKRAALWPPQRTTVWQRGCDRGLHVNSDGLMVSPDDANQRVLLDGAPADCIGSAGLRRERALQDVTVLTSKHRMPPPVLVKAALTLLETRLTGQSTALFSQTFAMRDDWPFIDEWVSRRLPSPLEVTGPCLARVAEIITVDPDMNVMEWLQKLKAEQDVLVKHCHAPYRVVFDQLNENSEYTGEEDDVVVESPKRIIRPKAMGTVADRMNGYVQAQSDGLANGQSDGRTNGVADGSVGDEVAGGKSFSEESAVAKGYTNGYANDYGYGKDYYSNGVPRPSAAQRLSRSFSTSAKQQVSSNPSAVGVIRRPTVGRARGYTTGLLAGKLLFPVKKVSAPNDTYEASPPSILPPARDGDVMENIRKRINFQWLPIFANDKDVKPQVRVASSSHFNEVGLAVKSGMLDDHKTIWIKMEWDDGNIRRSEAKAWIEEMINTVAKLGCEESWTKKISEL